MGTGLPGVGVEYAKREGRVPRTNNEVFEGFEGFEVDETWASL